jgi:hypothetical protein
VLSRGLASAARSRMQPNATAVAAAAERQQEPRRIAEGERRWPALPPELRRWLTMLRYSPGGGMSRRPFESQARILADQECLLASQLRALDGAFYRVLQYEEVLRSPRQHALELARFLRMERSTDAMVSSFTQNVRASRRPPPSEEQEAYAAGLRLQACDPQVVWEQGRGG